MGGMEKGKMEGPRSHDISVVPEAGRVASTGPRTDIRGVRAMARLERKHSLATRIFHWINVPVLAVMI